MKKISLGVVFLIILLFSACSFMDTNEEPKDEDFLYTDLSEKWTYRPKTKLMLFESNGVQLYSRILMASGRTKKPTIVFLHGMPGFEKNTDIGQALRRGGYNCVYFSYTGSWGNKGVFNLKNSINDTEALLNNLKLNSDSYNIDMENIFLCGFSMGADVAFLTANKCEDVKGVISISPWNAYTALNKKTDKMKKSYANWLEKVYGINIPNGKEFMDEIMNNSNFSLKFIEKLQTSNLHLFQNASEKSSFLKDVHVKNKDKIIVVNACDHSFSNKRIATANIIYKWIKENSVMN